MSAVGPDGLGELRGNFRAAFWRGYESWGRGEDLSACPYLDELALIGKGRQSVTWSRAYKRAWVRGWRYAALR